MYQGKHLNQNKRKRRKNREKAIVLLTSLVLLLALLIGGTVAFMIASDGPITNLFTDSTVTCQVHEESFDGTTKTNVTISNTGDTEAYIRAAIVVTWKDSVGNVYGAKPVVDRDYTIIFDSEHWFQGSDKYYYYKYPVAPNVKTSALIKSCTVIQENTPAGYGLNVEILGSAIQSVPVSVVNEKWPAVNVTTPHGNLTKVD